MHVMLVHIRVLPDHLDAFLDAMAANHAGSVREPGNRRFDVLRDPADPTKFLIYEAYVDADAAGAHKTTTHYLEWRDRVALMMAEPRRGEPWEDLAFESAEG